MQRTLARLPARCIRMYRPLMSSLQSRRSLTSTTQSRIAVCDLAVKRRYVHIRFLSSTTVPASPTAAPQQTVIPPLSIGEAIPPASSLPLPKLEEPPTSTHSTSLILRYALVGNVIIGVCKLVVWVLTGSSAIFAELIHTVCDVSNQLLLNIGFRQSRRLADERHPYGYGRSAFVYSLISSVNIFWIGGAFTVFYTVYNSHQRRQAEEAAADGHTNAAAADNKGVLDDHWLATWLVLLASITIDGYVLSVSLRELSRSRPAAKASSSSRPHARVSLFRHFLRLRNPLMKTTIMEDAAAVTGVIIAAIGISTNNHMYDDLASLTIAGLMGAVAVTLAKQNYRHIMGQTIGRKMTEQINGTITRRATVRSLSHIRTEWNHYDHFTYQAVINFDNKLLTQMIMDKKKSVQNNYNNNNNQIQRMISTQPTSSTIASNLANEYHDYTERIHQLIKTAVLYNKTKNNTSSSISSSSALTTPISNYDGEEEERRFADDICKVFESFADDLTDIQKAEVRDICDEIRRHFPQAKYIELEYETGFNAEDDDDDDDDDLHDHLDIDNISKSKVVAKSKIMNVKR